jgi:uncharacterized membrane protein YcaP (DUF421 family)
VDFYRSLHAVIGQDSSGILWWQMSIRAVVIFLYGLVLIRLFGRRAFGKQSPVDIVIAIVIGSNLSRALTGNARFLPTLAATAIIVVLYWLIEHLAVRVHGVAILVKGRPIRLIRAGQIDEAALRRVGISRSDIEEASRQSGLVNLDSVQDAVFERSGKISTLSASGR